MSYQFKHGDRVTCDFHGSKICDGRVSINSDGTGFICQNEFMGLSADELFGYKFSLMTWPPYKEKTVENAAFSVTNLKLMEKTLDNLEVVDSVWNDDGGEFIVLGVCGSVYLLSTDTNCEIGTFFFTAKYLRDNGYTVKNTKEETIEIDGKKYKKSEVSDRVKELKPVE